MDHRTQCTHNDKLHRSIDRLNGSMPSSLCHQIHQPSSQTNQIPCTTDIAATSTIHSSPSQVESITGAMKSGYRTMAASKRELGRAASGRPASKPWRPHGGTAARGRPASKRRQPHAGAVEREPAGDHAGVQRSSSRVAGCRPQRRVRAAGWGSDELAGQRCPWTRGSSGRWRRRSDEESRPSFHK